MPPSLNCRLGRAPGQGHLIPATMVVSGKSLYNDARVEKITVGHPLCTYQEFFFVVAESTILRPE